jgi:hypothetical protein
MMGYGQIIYILLLPWHLSTNQSIYSVFLCVCKLTLERRHSQLVYDTTLLCFLSSFAKTEKKTMKEMNLATRGEEEEEEEEKASKSKTKKEFQDML